MESEYALILMTFLFILNGQPPVLQSRFAAERLSGSVLCISYGQKLSDELTTPKNSDQDKYWSQIKRTKYLAADFVRCLTSVIHQIFWIPQEFLYPMDRKH